MENYIFVFIVQVSLEAVIFRVCLGLCEEAGDSQEAERQQ